MRTLRTLPTFRALHTLQDAEERLAEHGSLRLHLDRGAGLLAADKGGTSDPYVVVHLGKTLKRSHVVKKTLDPQWGQTLLFNNLNMRQLLQTSLVLDVYDQVCNRCVTVV